MSSFRRHLVRLLAVSDLCRRPSGSVLYVRNREVNPAAGGPEAVILDVGSVFR